MNSPEIVSILNSRFITLDELNSAPKESVVTPPKSKDFKTIKLGKMKLNSKREVNSAKIFINKNKVIIKNLSKLEPLSHLVDEEKLSSLLRKIMQRLYYLIIISSVEPRTTKDYTTLSHLKINPKNITEENFLIRRKKPKKKT